MEPFALHPTLSDSLGQTDGFILEQVQQNVTVVIYNNNQLHKIILTNRVLLRSSYIDKIDKKCQESRRLWVERPPRFFRSGVK